MNKASISSWGPSAWTYIHAMSYSYPDLPTIVNKLNIYNFIYYFARSIPCKRCRDDFVLYIDKNLPEREKSPYLENKRALVNFLVDAHNYVNQKLNKRVYTYAEVDSMYIFQKDSSCVFMFILVALILCVVYAIIRKHNYLDRYKI